MASLLSLQSVICNLIASYRLRSFFRHLQYSSHRQIHLSSGVESVREGILFSVEINLDELLLQPNPHLKMQQTCFHSSFLGITRSEAPLADSKTKHRYIFPLISSGNLLRIQTERMCAGNINQTSSTTGIQAVIYKLVVSALCET